MAFFNSILLAQGDQYKQYAASRGRPLGTRGYTRDGRAFRWTKNGATALTPGLLVQSETVGTESDDQLVKAGGVVSSGSTKITLNFSTNITLTTALLVNEYAEGFLFVNHNQGVGQMVQVASHETATSAAADGHSTVMFMPGNEFTTQVSTASELGIVKNPYDDVVRTTNTLTGPVVGIAPMYVTANYYFWLQTWGPATAKFLSSGTNLPKVGYPVVAELSTDGDVAALFGDATTKRSSIGGAFSTGMRNAILLMYREALGTVIELGATGETGIIDLKLAP